MIAWEDDNAWARCFIPFITPILGTHLIGEAPYEEDARRNTDLVVLRMEPVRIGCRVRRYSYLSKFGNQITIRTDRPSGADTELAKILTGWGDFFFYCFASENEERLARWGLYSISIFRIWHHRYLRDHAGEIPGEVHANSDGSSSFRAYALNILPEEFTVARNGVPRSGQAT